MSADAGSRNGTQDLKTGLRWAWFVGGVVFLILPTILFAGVSMHINPPSNRELVDPKRPHLPGEFTEANGARA